MSDDNAHAGSLNAQLRQAERDGDLPDEIAARHDLDGEEPGDGESRDGNGGIRPVPPGVPNTPEECDE